jgi:SNF2 family DNA or RNA helicase
MNQSEVYQKLLEIRKKRDLKLKRPKYLKDKLDDGGGLNLRYYQSQAVLHLMVMNRFVLGDDTGLGKTLECIASLCHIWSREENQKAIIITTKSSSGQWEDEFNKFTYGVNVHRVSSKGGPEKRKKVYEDFLSSTGPSVLIINYAIIKKDYSLIQDWESYILILDECSAVKSTGTQVHQVCFFMAKKASRVWGVSATIIKNNLLEGFGIYKVVLPSLFGTKSSFIKDFCVTKMQNISGNRRIPIIVGYRKKDIERFKEKIDPYFLGRPKHEVATELPSLICKVINTRMDKKQDSIYEDALNGLLMDGDSEAKKLVALVHCQQVANHPLLIDPDCDVGSSKLETLFDMLKEGDLEGEKVIIFSRFKKMVSVIMDRVKKEFKGEDYCLKITGDENDEGRKRARDLFQNEDSNTKIVCITMAGGEAINLQAAKAIIFYDTPFSAGDYLQILGRMIRIGSAHSSVYGIHLVSERYNKGDGKTIDKHVMNILTKKMELVEGVLGKRIVGDSRIFDSKSGTNDLFEVLRDELKSKRKK